MTYPLSIVIVNFNTGKHLTGCIRSIQKTTANLLRPKIELIIIDNASTDESITSITRSAGHSTMSSDRIGSGLASITGTTGVKIIQNKTNLGFAKAVNRGIKEASGEHILLLNPDTKVCPGAIKKMVEFAREHKDTGVVGSKLLNPNGSVQSSVIPFPTMWRAIQEFWLGKKGVYSKYAPETKEPIIVDAVVGAAFLVTPQAREKVGLMDERFWMYFEDLDYCRRVKNAGLKVYYLPTAEVVHYHGVSGRDVVDKKDQWRRLVPGSKVYHGLIQHHFINFVLWSGQKIKSLL